MATMVIVQKSGRLASMSHKVARALIRTGHCTPIPTAEVSERESAVVANEPASVADDSAGSNEESTAKKQPKAPKASPAKATGGAYNRRDMKAE